MLQNICTVLFLVGLEGLLSFDNALALAAIARHLPAKDQQKALTYGVAGAFTFRFAALFFMTWILQSDVAQIAGGLYLLMLSGKYFLDTQKESPLIPRGPKPFWITVVQIELVDIMFSADSILASLGVTQKLAIVAIGGCLGIFMMRFASGLFIRLINRFPNFEATAYLLVLIIGVKLVAQGTHIGLTFEGWRPENIVAWIITYLSVAYGFVPTAAQLLEESTL